VSAEVPAESLDLLSVIETREPWYGFDELHSGHWLRFTLRQTVLDEIITQIGHALGLGDNANPNSIMYYEATGSNQTLDGTDIAGVQSLYGPAHQQLVQAMAGFGADLSAAASISQSLVHTPPPMIIAPAVH
jgi:hypothetical protein